MRGTESIEREKRSWENGRTGAEGFGSVALLFAISFYMRPPIPPPEGDSLPVAPAPPSRLGVLLTALVLGAFFVLVGSVEVLLVWNSWRNGPFPAPSLTETLLTLGMGGLLLCAGVVGLVQRKRR